MWTPLLLCLCVANSAFGGSSVASPWKANTQYQYAVRARTLTGLHQVANQYAGVVMKATANVQQKSDNVVSVQISEAQYAEVHANLSQGWSSPIPEAQLHYQQTPLSDKPFELHYNNGAVSSMVVSQNIPTWELNILKSIASQLQVDTQAQNLQKSRINSLPSQNSANGVYKTMEDSVGGECETLYDISPLPKVVLQNKPELAPLPHLQADGQLIDIVKTRNFSNCDVPSTYHFGISGLTDWEPASNQMGNFLARSSVSRVVISGNLQRYIIQSSVTTHKIIIAPFMYEKQNAMVSSRMNLTLIDVKSASGSPKSPPNPETIKSLVYEYEPASSDENTQRPEIRHVNNKYDSNRSRSSPSSSSSSSSDSSSSESQEQNKDSLTHKNKINEIKPMESSTDKQNYPSANYNSVSNENDQKFGSYKMSQIKKQDQDSSSSSSSSSDSDSSSSSSSFDSSEEDNWQEKPSLAQAPNVPFMPMFVANRGNSIQSVNSVQAVPVVKKLAEQIANEVQTPSAIPGQKTLSKFIILAAVIRTMNAQQIQQAAKELYYPLSKASSSSSEDAQKYLTWAAYRDAVAEAGTGPALLAMKEWIESKMVKEEEAAQLLATLPNAARFPNTEYMKAFFELVTSPEVQDQRFLNTSAVLSFTRLARKAFVNNATAHNRYPVHSFGALKPRKEQPVVQQYIPYLARALKVAVSNEDSIKIQTYIIALGSLAHPRILNVFEPFLEGKQPMTHFQRLTIIASLSQLAKTYPKVARPVLYRIYQNTGEATELRVAAVFQLMKTNPPAQLLQRMAEFTNDDEDVQVNSAVQSAIRSAANKLQEIKMELKMNAQAAVNLLSTQKHAAQHSKMYLRSYVARHLNLAYRQSYSHIGSNDGFIPSNVFYSLRQNLGGFQKQAFRLSAMTSSLSALTDLLEEQFGELDSSSYKSKGQQNGQSSNSEPNWSFDKIKNLLNIQPSEQQQVEGSLLLSTLVGERFFAFDNHTIEQLPEWVKRVAASLRSGKSFNYTKVTDLTSINIGFPTETGLPFYCAVSTPTLLYIGGEAQVKTHPDLASGSLNQIQPPKTVNASVELRVLISTQLHTSIGFSTPFNRNHYSTGVNKNIQINVPISAEIDVDVVNKKVAAKVRPLDQSNKQNLFEFSTEPYTSKQNIVELIQRPNEILEDSQNNQIIHLRQPNQIHATHGQYSTGFAFDFDYVSEQKFVDFPFLFNEARKHDPLSAALYMWTEESINLNKITLAYNPQKSSAQQARFTAAYLAEKYEEFQNIEGDKNYRNSERRDNQQESEDNLQVQPIDQISSNVAQPSSSSPDSQSRQQEFLQKAKQGIQDSITKVVDVSAEFQGQTKAQYVATIAVARSDVSPKSRLLFFAKQSAAGSQNNKHIVAVAESSMPKLPEMNYENALSADPTSYFGVEFAYGDSSSQASAKVQFKGRMWQSAARRQYVEQSPLAQLCRQQMQQSNNIQDACRNITTQANLLDQYKMSVQFENVPDKWKNATYKAYSMLRFAYYPHISEDLITPQNPNKIELDANIAPDLMSVNVSMASPLLSARIINVRLNRYAAAILAERPSDMPMELFRATCAVDNNQVETFDNSSYPIKLGQCWHAMLHYTPKEDPTSSSSSDEDDKKEVSILVRDASSSEAKEVLIAVGENSIYLSPSPDSSSTNVLANGQQVLISKNKITTLEDQNGQIYAVINVRTPGEIKVSLLKKFIDMLYNGKSLKVKAQKYESEVRGLCGNYNAQPSDDFTTPQDCVLQDPREFAASYALDDSSCQGPAKEYKQKAQQRVAAGQCYRHNVIYGNVVADQQDQSPPKSKSQKSSKNKDKSSEEPLSLSCSQQRTKVIEVAGKHCFSKISVHQCASHCKPQGQVQKQVEFVCLDPSAATEHFRLKIRKGLNLDFSNKKNTQSHSIDVPETCVAL